MKILVAYKIPQAAFVNAPKDWEFIIPETVSFSKQETINLIKDCDILLSIFTIPVDKDIIDAGKKLKLISNYGVGYNNVDTVYARSLGIAVCNTPQAVCEPTAELAMALMLGIARRIGECDRRIRTEKENMWGVMENLGVGLYGKTLGIIGLGRIGKSLAIKASAFGMNIIYNNPRSRCDLYKYVEMEELLATSDFISINAPLTPSTNKLIGHKEFQLMKKTAFIINTARGAIIDEKALCDVLQNHQIAGAALDVFEHEPNITETLYKLDNVILMPHVGTGTIDARVNIGIEAIQNIINFNLGKPTNIVNN